MKNSRRCRVIASALVVGGVLSIASAPAFASASLRVSPANGLVQAQVVRVSGSGLAARAYGYVLECNSAPHEPTEYVGPPFDERVPIGCSPPSLKYIVSTSSDGALSTTIKVHVSRNLGPPCDVHSVFGPCGGRPDSAGQGPRKDAQNYPCPPSPAQQAAGVTCSLVFYDTAHEVISTPITFLGLGPAAKTPPPTTPPATTPPATTPPATTPPGSTHTPAPGTGTSPGGSGSSGGTTPGSPVLTKSTGGGSGADASTSGGSGSTGSGAVGANSGSLAFTGLGTTGKLLAVLGAFFLLFGLVLMFVNVRRVGAWLLGL